MSDISQYDFYLQTAKANGATGFGPDAKTLLGETDVKIVKKSQGLVHAYTLNDVASFTDSDKKLKDISKTGYFTDRPELLLTHWKKNILSEARVEQLIKAVGF